jgi:hypothetical protein
MFSQCTSDYSILWDQESCPQPSGRPVFPLPPAADQASHFASLPIEDMKVKQKQDSLSVSGKTANVLPIKRSQHEQKKKFKHL